MTKNKNQTIAVIDSGIGGISILKQLIKKFGAGNYIYLADNLFMPYGNKSRNVITMRIKELIFMLKSKYNVSQIIIACNTASTCLGGLKLDNVITMQFDKKHQYFATELTKKTLKGYNVISDKTLATQIEQSINNKEKLRKIIYSHVKKHNLYKFKTLVLACTHYELTKDLFCEFCPQTNVINNSEFIINSINPKNTCNELNTIILLTKKDNMLESKIMQMIKEY